MDPIPSAVELSFLRSPPRKRMMQMLSSLGEASPSQLARALGTSPTRVRWMMEGHGAYFSEELSPLALGLATHHREGRRHVYVITTRGRRIMRRFAARALRQARRREAVAAADAAYQTRGGQVETRASSILRARDGRMGR